MQAKPGAPSGQSNQRSGPAARRENSPGRGLLERKMSPLVRKNEGDNAKDYKRSKPNH
jgi:hypothetical protein